MIRKGSPGPGADDQTPMMRQYFAAKSRHPDEILFFRMGDFFEMFFEDAKVAAEALGIALTSRSKDRSGKKIPMAGVPAKAADAYIRRLLATGHRVAICDQVEDPRHATGIVDRQVVRVVTPGTLVDEDALEEDRPLHLTALVREEEVLGISWVDLSTGRFHAEELASDRQWEEVLHRISPAECIYPSGDSEDHLPPLAWLRQQLPRCALTPFPEWNFERATGRERLLAHFGTRTLEGFGCEHLGAGLRAAGALIHYLQETQRHALPHITRLVQGSSGHHLRLDAATHRALELLELSRTGERRGSLLGHLDRSVTPLGARQLRDWLTSPLLDRAEILERQDAVAALVDDEAARGSLRETLRGVRDIERLASRLPLGRVNGRDLKTLELSIRVVPELKEQLAGFEARLLTAIYAALDERRLLPLADAIGAAIVDEPPPNIAEGGIIRDGYDPDLDELRSIGREGVDWIARFQEQESRRTGIPNLKVGYNRVFGYFIEVTHTHREKIPDDYTRKQTLKNAERYITPALKEKESRVLGARDRAIALELELFQKLRGEIEAELRLLQETAHALGVLDALSALALVASADEYVRPEIVEEPVLDVEEGCHPVLAAGAGRADFTANDLRLGGDHGTLAVITGPNMAGKSTYIRQAALITILAQIGSFVPARRARIGIADRIFTRVGAADDLTRGQSTFMVEMTETANILNNATERSLVILDEVGRGTSTLDGISLAWSIAEHLVERIGARTFFATHYHELTELEERFPGRVRNLNVAVREWRDEIVFLHKIVPGGTDKAYGIHVARLAGIPEEVLERGRDLLAHLEREVGRRSPGRAPRAEERSRQLDLFAQGSEDVARRLRGIDPDELTPLQALQLIAELRALLP